MISHGPLARYVKLRVANAPGMPGTFSPTPRVSDPDMHHGTCGTHVPWCMPGSLTSDFLWSAVGENVPGIPDACATCNFTYLVRGPWRVKTNCSERLNRPTRRRRPRYLLLGPMGHVFRMAWEIMSKSYYNTFVNRYFFFFVRRYANFSAMTWAIYPSHHGCEEIWTIALNLLPRNTNEYL